MERINKYLEDIIKGNNEYMIYLCHITIAHLFNYSQKLG
jgi:hypothetical protein